MTGWIRGASHVGGPTHPLARLWRLRCRPHHLRSTPNARHKRSKAAPPTRPATPKTTPWSRRRRYTRGLVAGDTLQSRDDEFADDRVSENEPDDMGNEQTWPTEEEMQAAELFAKQRADGEMPPPPALPGTTPRPSSKGVATPRTTPSTALLGSSNRRRGEEDDDDEEYDDDSMMPTTTTTC